MAERDAVDVNISDPVNQIHHVQGAAEEAKRHCVVNLWYFCHSVRATSCGIRVTAHLISRSLPLPPPPHTEITEAERLVTPACVVVINDFQPCGVSQMQNKTINNA